MTWRNRRSWPTWAITGSIIIGIIIITIIGAGRPWVRSVTTSAAPTAAAAAAAVPEAGSICRGGVAANDCADPAGLYGRIAIRSGCEDGRRDRRNGLAPAYRDRRSAPGARPRTSGVYLVAVSRPCRIPPVLRTRTAAATATLSRGPPPRRLYDGPSRAWRSPPPSGTATRRRSTRRRVRRESCAAQCPTYMFEDRPVYPLKGFLEIPVCSSKWYSPAPIRIWSISIDRRRHRK